MLDRKLAHCDLQNLIVRYLFHHRCRWVFMAVTVMVVFVFRTHEQSFLPC
jgi:hypothetical protein